MAISIEAVGIETLLRMAEVDAYNEWIYRKIWPFLGERILEVGCGIGNMTQYLLERELVVCIDLLEEALDLIRTKFRDIPHLQLVRGDICDDATASRLTGYHIDTVVMLNVLEHIDRDHDALRSIYNILPCDGRLVLLVPAGQILYGSLDRALGHYRRYDMPTVRSLLKLSGYTIESLHYMNMLGVAGWFINSRVLRRQLLPKPQLAMFNRLAPYLERLEAAIPPPYGQSIIAIGRKLDRHNNQR